MCALGTRSPALISSGSGGQSRGCRAVLPPRAPVILADGRLDLHGVPRWTLLRRVTLHPEHEGYRPSCPRDLGGPLAGSRTTARSVPSCLSATFTKIPSFPTSLDRFQHGNRECGPSRNPRWTSSIRSRRSPSAPFVTTMGRLDPQNGPAEERKQRSPFSQDG
jgi:hypothetical protein